MKLFKLFAIILPLFALAACSSSPDKGMQEGDVLVEDRGAESAGVDGQGADGEDMGAEAKVVVGEDQYAGNELNDPDSPLSNRTVYFEYDSDVVRNEDQQTLQAHAAYLAENPNLTVRLEGHTDERGSREYNLALGERRALSVRRILMLQGASIDQFQVTSFGEERPAEEGGDEYAWSQNRRVELVYVGR
ncbi:peptidoglycan-associated lipoprotein Pal [uncultured Methylophaga sp.]|jgi:peptidoglycan-associated lipoprotein|uniref:peptidoglycan-associated lipoprotein Pal n=1 Tax=uncultured Methylophaga sp. TaxID=285271 RepID=UPI002617EB3F|nr:peptidoglycan-associated lipoprotein Pal [uncultured Methylophaga sp.]